jgi:hypothetical protein
MAHLLTAMIRPKSQNFKLGHDGILSIGNFIHPKKIFRNSSAAKDVVTEEYFEKFFCCTKMSFVRAQIHSFQINIFGLESISTLPEEFEWEAPVKYQHFGFYFRSWTPK